MQNKSDLSLGSFLKKLREDKNVSLAEVESATSISRSYINRLENDNRQNPSLDNIGRLVQYYEIPFSTFAEFCDCKNVEGQVQDLDYILLNTNYLFAGVEINVDFKMIFRDLIKQLENYCTKLEITRQDEAKIVDIAVKLREKMLSE